jgi:hypothetical protein
MSVTFSPYTAESNSPPDLVNAVLARSPGITINQDSIRFGGSESQVSFYDGSLSELGIGPGILLTTGIGTPATTNTNPSSGTTSGKPGDEDLEKVLAAAQLPAVTRDAVFVEFSFVVDNPRVKSITFDLVFGSEEYPEFADNTAAPLR